MITISVAVVVLVSYLIGISICFLVPLLFMLYAIRNLPNHYDFQSIAFQVFANAMLIGMVSSTVTVLVTLVAMLFSSSLSALFPCTIIGAIVSTSFISVCLGWIRKM